MRRIAGIYLVTENDHLKVARAALDAGVHVIQLRDKQMTGRMLVEMARELKQLAERPGAVFLVNDRVDVALAAGADGVHVGQEDIPVELIRRFVPEDFIVGVSVKTVEQAVKAEADGASYVAVSPVFETPTKPDAGAGLGLESLSQIRKAVSIPVVAIGGINRTNITDVFRAGADAAAVVSAITRADSPYQAARELVSLYEKWCEK